MMRTLSLALRNLLRNRRRSLTTLLAMVVGMVAILIFGGYRSNIVYGMQTGFIQGSGHFQIQRADYFLDGGDNPTAYGIADYDRIIDAVRSDPELAQLITVVTPTLQLGGIAGDFASGVSRSVMALGIVAEDRNRQLAWNEYHMLSYARPFPLVGTPRDTVVIGTGVARKLRLCRTLQVPDCHQSDALTALGQPATKQAAAPADILALTDLERQSASSADARNRIEMLAATAHGAPNVASLSVIEARNMGIKALDDVFLAMHLTQAQHLIYGSNPAQVTAVIVQLHHTRDMPRARARLEQILRERFPDEALEVLDFKRLNPMYGQSQQFMDSLFGFISILIGVIVLFTIGNTMSTAVVERTVEIGTLRAMGLRRSGIRRLFLVEGMVLALIGAVLGLILALIVASLINASGITWTPPGYSYAYFILVRVWQDPALIAGSVAGLFAVTIASAWLPASRAARLAIVDALRHA